MDNRGYNIRLAIKTFIMTSTIHGVSHIGRGTDLPKRMFWVTAFVVCLSALIWQLSALIKRYDSGAKQTNMQVDFLISKNNFKPDMRIHCFPKFFFRAAVVNPCELQRHS